jgi:hypothetical protein
MPDFILPDNGRDNLLDKSLARMKSVMLGLLRLLGYVRAP